MPASINSESKRQVGDGTLRTQLRSQLRARRHPFVLEVQRDIKKAFDHVVRAQMADAAGTAGYPMRALYVSLMSYCWPRRLIMQGLCGDWVVATRGIAAGGNFAVFELAALLAPAMIRLQQ